MGFKQLNEESVLQYVNYALDAQKKGLSATKYSIKYNVDYKKLSNTHYRLFWTKIGKPEERNEREMYVEYAKIYLELKNSSISKFVRDESLDRNKFNVAVQHVQYWNIANKHNLQKNDNEIKEEIIKNPNNIEPMRFISIKEDEKIVLQSIKEPEQELIKKKNEIELNISKGIKVIVDSDVNTETMIRIIELLKDL